VGERKKFLLRVDQQVYEAVQRWADEELRSVNAQIEFLLRRSLNQAGRPVRDAPAPRRGRPPKDVSAKRVDDPSGDSQEDPAAGPGGSPEDAPPETGP
jgi:hypothetical protein